MTNAFIKTAAAATASVVAASGLALAEVDTEKAVHKPEAVASAPNTVVVVNTLFEKVDASHINLTKLIMKNAESRMDAKIANMKPFGEPDRNNALILAAIQEFPVAD
ncbi:MAG: hypothetical protein AAGB02_05500 [Pseudomonadota bacterium]